MNRLSFVCEILKHAPGTAPPPDVSPVDVTDRVLLDGIGSVNRAIERDLLSFRTGDLTLRLDNQDGFFEELFTFFGPTDRWQLRLTRDGALLFRGILVATDGIQYDRREREVELTAYGLAKVLDEMDAGVVARSLGPYSLSVGVNPSDTTLVLTPNNNGLLARDVLHLDDQQGSEDVTIKRALNATDVELVAGVAGGYVANETKVTVPKPGYRYKGIEFLVGQLFEGSPVPLVEFNLGSAILKKSAPILVNLNRLALNAIWGAPSERNGRVYITVQSTGGPITGGTFYTSAPDSDWTKEDANHRPWVDWSRYYSEGSSPATPIRYHADLPVSVGNNGQRPEMGGYDFRSSPQARYEINREVATERIDKLTTSDGGTNWSVTPLVDLPDIAGHVIPYANLRHVEYDRVRDAIYATWQTLDASQFSRYYDIGSATWFDLRQSDDISEGKYYFAPVFCEDLDCVFMLRGTFANIETDFQIAAFRGRTRLWVRSFPSCFIDDETEVNQGPVFPTETLRYVNGELLCVVINNGKMRLVRSSDEFRTYEIGDILDGQHVLYFGSRALGAYWTSIAYKPGDSTQRTLLAAAPLQQALVELADFTGKSRSQALSDLAAQVNAWWWVDDEGGGHFVARDLVPAAEVLEIGDRILEASETAIWDESRQYVEVSGAGATGTAGDKDFASDSFSLSAPFAPNEAYAQVVAGAMHEFISKARPSREVRVWDPDGYVYRPMYRVTIDGVRWSVYESDHEIADEEWSLTVLLDLEAA